MTNAELLAQQMDDTRDWTLKLIADLQDGDWTFQPEPGMAHALWLCGHLTVSQNTLIHIRCLGKKGILEESFTSHFPIGSPVKSADKHDYPSVESVLSRMREVHEETLRAIRNMSEDLLSQPAYAADGHSPHPHYRDKRGAASHCSRHEAFHAGQVASIRRMLGKSFLR